MSTGPLSLQTCCIIRLTNDFETFSAESLAPLPLKLRYELLKNLPAADVCQLEQSSFVEGLDMEKVWDSIARKCGIADANTATRIKALNRSKDSKEDFFSEVCKIIFHNKSSWGRIIRILLLLFSNDVLVQIRKQHLAIGDGVQCYSSLHDYETVLQLPPRCQKEYNSNWSGLSYPAGCIQLVLEKTGYHPKSLEINDAYEFSSRFLSSPWRKGGEYHHLLVEYLSEVCYLTIHFNLLPPYMYTCSTGENVEEVVPFIMQVLSKKGHLRLKEFSIINNSDEVCTIGPYLKTSGKRNAIESLSIESGCLGALYSDAALLELAEIIESQTSLCRLQLVLLSSSIFYASSVYGSARRLCATLTGLLRQPQFCQMEIFMPMPSSFFQEIIHSFMVVPRNEDCSLSLGSFRGTVFIKDDQSARELSCLNPPQENVIHKTLILRLPIHCQDTSQLQWLLRNVVLRLKELCLQLHFRKQPPSLTHLLSHPRMEVERLSLSFGHCILSDQNFEHLLQNIHLKHLSIYIYRFGQINIPSLVNGLHKQAQVGSLESLHVVFGDYDEDDITQLFDAIVSLPQLENFTLDINFHDQHADILYKLWKSKAGGKRFKRLCCAISSPERSVLQNITHQLVHLT